MIKQLQQALERANPEGFEYHAWEDGGDVTVMLTHKQTALSYSQTHSTSDLPEFIINESNIRNMYMQLFREVLRVDKAPKGKQQAFLALEEPKKLPFNEINNGKYGFDSNEALLKEISCAGWTIEEYIKVRDDRISELVSDTPESAYERAMKSVQK